MHPSAVKRSTAALLLLLLLLLVAATLLTTAAAAGDASGSVDEGEAHAVPAASTRARGAESGTVHSSLLPLAGWAAPRRVAQACMPLPTCACPAAVAIMRRLHKLLHDGHTPYLGRHAGWAQRDNPTPPCQWENVKCRDGRVVHM